MEKVSPSHECTGEELRGLMDALVLMGLHQQQYHNASNFRLEDVCRGVLVGFVFSPRLEGHLANAMKRLGVTTQK